MKDYNLKTIKQEFKSKGIFYTTKDLALYLNFLSINAGSASVSPTTP